MTSTAQQQRRPNGPAAIAGIVLFIGGIVLLLNGIPPLFGTIGQFAGYSAVMGAERAFETLLPYAAVPLVLSIAGAIMIRIGFGLLRRQGTKGAQWARSEWQERQPEVQQRFQSARDQLQAQGASVWEQTQRAQQGVRDQAQARAVANAPTWAPTSGGQQQRQGWPGQPGQQGQQQRPPQQQRRQPPPPQPGQRQQQPPRGSSTLERMQQRISDAATATDRARDAATARHEQQAAALQQRAERAAAHVAPQYAEPGISFGSPALVGNRRASSILASSSLRSTSLSRTSLSLDSLRLRR